MAVTMADEYAHWLTAILRTAFQACRLKRKPTLVKLMTVSNLDTAKFFITGFNNAKGRLARKESNKYYLLRDWGVVSRKEGREYSIYLDNSKAIMRRIAKERRRK